MTSPRWFCRLLLSVVLTSISMVAQDALLKNRQGKPDFEQTDLFKGGEGGYSCYINPGIVVSPKGTILVFVEARQTTCEDWGSVNILLRRSLNNGKTWLPVQVVAQDGERAVNQPTPVVDRDTGTIWLPFSKNNQQVFAMKSLDEGASWSTPIDITRSVKDSTWSAVGPGPGHGIQLLRNGRLLIPAWGDLSPRPITLAPANWGKIQFSYVFYSDDHGETWQRSQPLDMDMSDECEVVETADGRVYMNMRSRQNKKQRAYSWSSDGGETWSPVKFDAALPEPSVQGSVVRFTFTFPHQKNRILLGYPRNARERNNLTVHLSYDEGETWPVTKIVNEGRSGYSDLAIAADMSILFAYDGGDKSLGVGQKVVLARFNLAWLTDGADGL